MHIITSPNDPALAAFAAYDGKVIELFAGPGGMSEGAKLAGIPARSILGIENDHAACETATAAGHPRYLADITALDPRSFGRAWGLHGSSPCPGFSAAGKGEGRKDLPMLALALKRLATGEDPAGVMAEVIATQHDSRSALSLEPMVWLTALRPEWITLEQVPAVLPLWQEYAAALRQLGYHVWAGTVSAETVGVPQTRKRAILLGSRSVDVSGGIRASHSRFHTTKARRGQLDPGVLPYVTMGDVLDMAPATMRSNYGTGGDPAARGERTTEEPAPTVTSKVGRNKWLMGDVYNSHGCIRQHDEPAPTLTASMDNGNFRVRAAGDTGSGRRVSVQEAGILQSFPADYPWRGTLSEQYQQAGNAVPPLLGQAMIETVLGRR